MGEGWSRSPVDLPDGAVLGHLLSTEEQCLLRGWQGGSYMTR